MKLSPLLAPLALLAVAACSSSSPTSEDVGDTAAAISTSEIVSRAMQWVDADLHYCQAARGDSDGDSSCWAWEGASHTCDRQSNSAWNAYRSDCSGFVTWAWGLPPVGDGGYVTSEFAPYSTAFSHTIDGLQLEPGDALNKTPDEHIVLFKQWVSAGHSAIFMEEPGCSVATPYAHEFTSDVTISGSEVYIEYEGATFYAIRYNGVGASGGGSSDACTYGDGYCTATMQCESGEWVPRTSDPTACTSGPGATAGGSTGSTACAYGDGYCTDTMQCDSGTWVARSSDPAACTSGPGVETSAGVSDACSSGKGFCTETLQCDSGHWIVRGDDPNACTTVDDVSEACSAGDGYCTATLQCASGHWVPRTTDAAACTSGPGK